MGKMIRFSTMSKLQKAWIVAALVVLGILVLAVLARVTQSVNRTVPHHTIAKATTLLRGSSKWAHTAKQDKNPMMGLIHVSYALAYANAMRELLNDREIQQATGVDMRDHVNEMEAIQRSVITKLGDSCAKIRPEGNFAIAAGWLG